MADIKTYFKQPKGWRKNPKYIKAVKQLPCYHCTLPNTTAHHIIGDGADRGQGLKAPDTETMPLCYDCHAGIHRDYEMFDQQKAVEETRKKLIELNLILGVDIL